MADELVSAAMLTARLRAGFNALDAARAELARHTHHAAGRRMADVDPISDALINVARALSGIPPLPPARREVPRTSLDVLSHTGRPA